jgi:hypothetical protein
MIAKHSIKVFTLYDLIANNIIFITLTICNSITAIFNYYTIINLSLLQLQLTSHVAELEHLQMYIIVCQSFTFMALLFSFYFINPILEYNVNKNRRQLIIFFVSFVWKSLATVYCLPNSLQVLSIQDDLFCWLIQLSFVPILMFMSIIIVGLLGMSLAFIVTTCCFCINQIVTWSKTQFISVINETLTDGSENV